MNETGTDQRLFSNSDMRMFSRIYIHKSDIEKKNVLFFLRFSFFGMFAFDSVSVTRRNKRERHWCNQIDSSTPLAMASAFFSCLFFFFFSSVCHALA